MKKVREIIFKTERLEASIVFDLFDEDGKDFWYYSIRTHFHGYPELGSVDSSGEDVELEVAIKKAIEEVGPIIDYWETK